MLQVEGVSACYGGLTALRNIRFECAAGARVGIFGHNGAGKTTLLRCLIGAHVPSEGDVRLEREPIVAGDVPAAVKRGMAFVQQGHNVFPNLSVEQNLRVAGLMFDSSFAAEVLDIFPLLRERQRQRAGSMSGGEQQMLALGMALMTKPKWLLLDEPSTGLAPVIVRNVMARMQEVSRRFGTGLIVVEQNVPATLKVVDRALILRGAELVFDGEAAALAAKSDLWEWF